MEVSLQEVHTCVRHPKLSALAAHLWLQATTTPLGFGKGPCCSSPLPSLRSTHGRKHRVTMLKALPMTGWPDTQTRQHIETGLPT